MRNHTQAYRDIHSTIARVAHDYQYKEIFVMPPWLVKFWRQAQEFVRHWLTIAISKLAKSFGNGGFSSRLIGRARCPSNFAL
jgi:hypothetical protein